MHISCRDLLPQNAERNLEHAVQLFADAYKTHFDCLFDSFERSFDGRDDAITIHNGPSPRVWPYKRTNGESTQ